MNTNELGKISYIPEMRKEIEDFRQNTLPTDIYSTNESNKIFYSAIGGHSGTSTPKWTVEVINQGITRYNDYILKVPERGLYRVYCSFGLKGTFSLGCNLYSGMNPESLTVLRRDTNMINSTSTWVQQTVVWALELQANEYLELRLYGTGAVWDGGTNDNIFVEKIADIPA